MAVWERQAKRLPRKEPSFSSSLLDAIYRSIDETNEQQLEENFLLHSRRNNAAQVEEDIESLRRAIMIEKWMENYRHFPSNSGSSTDSSMFSSSETESSSLHQLQKQKHAHEKPIKKKSRVQKIYGDLKKVKEPISPGGKLASFLNSIFSPRKTNQSLVEWSSMRKSRSMKDTTTTTATTKTCSLASRSCLSKNRSSGDSKSKRSVRFCPVSVIVDEDSINNPSVATIGSHFIKKNMNNLRKNQELRDFHQNEDGLDDLSCGSSDLFELENIGRVGIGTYDEELPLYETTNLEMNHAIAGGLVM